MNTYAKYLDDITEPKKNQSITDYDVLDIVEYCTPSILGVKACAGAAVVDRYIALRLTLKTPIGNYSKTFKITKDVHFDWTILGRFRVKVAIDNFKETAEDFSFDFTGKLGVKVPILGWKYISFSHHFVIHKNQAELGNLSDAEYASTAAMSHA